MCHSDHRKKVRAKNKGNYISLLSQQTNCHGIFHLRQFLCLAYPFSSFWSWREVVTGSRSPHLKMVPVHRYSRTAQPKNDQRLQKNLGRARRRWKRLELCQYVLQNRIPGDQSSLQGNSPVLSLSRPLNKKSKETSVRC